MSTTSRPRREIGDGKRSRRSLSTESLSCRSLALFSCVLIPFTSPLSHLNRYYWLGQSADPPSHRLTHRLLARPPSAPSHPLASSSHPFVRPSSATPAPTLAFLDTLLPPSLLTKSPFPVPCIEDDDKLSAEKDPSKRPPERPHDGLIARRPFEGVYAQGEGRKERMPKRNEVMRLGKGTGLGRLVVRAVYPEEDAKLGMGEGKKRKRVSKERRERERARRSAVETGAKS